MQKDYTHISFVLDRSGSMSSIKQDTIGGFNTFLEAQKQAPGKATFTLVQFDNEYECLCQMMDIQHVLPLNDSRFVPRGSTALLDAIGRTINDTGKRLGDMPEADRPEKVLFVILTDGYENSSLEFNNQRINDMITHQRDVYKWEFVYLGANQDAIATAANMGIQANSTMTFTADSEGTQATYEALTTNAINYRTGTSTNLSFTPEQRSRAMGGKSKTASKIQVNR